MLQIWLLQKSQYTSVLLSIACVWWGDKIAPVDIETGTFPLFSHRQKSTREKKNVNNNRYSEEEKEFFKLKYLLEFFLSKNWNGEIYDAKP